MLARILFLILPFSAFSQVFTEQIRLNQIGFLVTESKVAVVTGKTNASDFYITSTNLRDTVFRGKIGATIRSNHSSTDVRKVDFTPLKQTGSFVVVIPDLGHSHSFRIGPDVFSAVAVASLKAFYFQRVSMPLEESFAGKWHRSAGHPDDRVVIHPSAASAGRPAGTVLSSPRGWYDAGDYNKYVVNSGITMATLMSAFEDYPDYFSTTSVSIPESSNAVPDILDEVLYNLRWMLTMQDPADGGVYHKCTNATFDGMVMPGVTRDTRYLVQKSTAAALDFTAVMAQAARIYQGYEKQFPGLADSCLNAARASWNWSLKNPEVVYDQEKLNKMFKPEVVTGAYGDGHFDDERFWASAELYRTTGDLGYLKLLGTIDQKLLRVPAWDHVAMLGVYSLLRQEAPAAYKEKWLTLKTMVLDLANRYVAYASSSAFGVPMGMEKTDFVWGSNSFAANQSILLLNAFRYTNDARYQTAALANADYLLGRNATGYCFVTGFGG
ncbi:MAG: glycoside hydrolase family 9 protein, partial [Cyclobacteriaceae bacterium]